MVIFIIMFLASVVALLLILIKKFKKRTKIVSSILCVALAIFSIIGLFGFKASDNNIHLTIDNKENTVTNFNQVLSGTFSSSSDISSIKYTIATEIDDYEVTDSGNAVIKDNTYSVDVQLKPKNNKITVTATTQSGNTEIKEVNISYDSGKIYELNENHIAYDSDTNTKYVDNIVLIYFRNDTSNDRRNEIVSSINGKVVGSINGVNQWQVEISPTNFKELNKICENLKNEDGVSNAFIDTISNVSIDVSINDPYKNAKGGDWYLSAIDAYSAWDYNERFSYIDIGIVDDGFDVGHEDLDGVIKFPNEDLKSNNKKAEHGTHVAGIIGANANNKKGMAGLVWKNKLLCIDWKPQGKQKWETENEVLSGLTYTVEAGAKVINYSLGKTGSCNYDEISKIETAANHASEVMVQLLGQNKDFVVVQSAGNGTKDGYAVDAKYNGLFASITNNDIDVSEYSNISKQDVLDRIIIVGNAKVNDDGNYQQAVHSNGGSRVNICAPGTNIYSTVPGEINDGLGGWINGAYANFDGTSMAAPMVTAVCGMVWSVNSKFTGAEVKDIVCNSYDKNIWVWDNPDKKHTTTDKYRMLNAKLSVEEAIRRTDGTGSISGTLKEKGTNSPIINREVKIYNEFYNSNNSMYTFIDKTTTDNTGSFQFTLPIGTYTLIIDNVGENVYSDYSYETFKMKVKVEANTFLVLLDDIFLKRIENNIPPKNYSWLVEPTIKADDIIVLDESYVPNGSVSIWNPDTNNSESSKAHSEFAIIEKDKKYSFVNYDGKVLSDEYCSNFGGCYCGEVRIYGDDTPNGLTVSKDSKIIEGFVGHGMGANALYYAENYKNLYIFSVGGPIDDTKVGEQPFAFRQLSNDEANNSYCSIGTARLVKISTSDVDNAKITEIKNKYALFKNMKLTSDFIFEKAYSDCYGGSNIAACKKDGKWGYYSYDGKEIISCQFDDVQNRIHNNVSYNAYLPTNGYIAVNKGGGYGYYNTDGKEIIPCGEFEQARPVYDGKAWVKKDGKWGVIKLDEATAGEIIIKDNSSNENVEQQEFNYNTTSSKYPEAISSSKVNELGECAFVCKYENQWVFNGWNSYIAESLDQVGVVSFNNEKNMVTFREILSYDNNSCKTKEIAQTGYSAKVSDEIDFSMFDYNNHQFYYYDEQLLIDSYHSDIGLLNMKPKFEYGSMNINRPLSILPLNEIDWSTVKEKKASNGRNIITFKLKNQ